MLAERQTNSVILIVDDNPDTIQLLSSMLTGLGELMFATSGQEALRLAEQYRPHLILLDIEMPGMDGYATCRALQEIPATQDCAIIFVTAHAGIEVEVRALEAGAVDFITKPFSPTVITARVQTQLALKHHADELRSLVNRDGLTGIYNRRFLDEQLDTEFRRHQRQQHSLGFALLDIDFFKPYNDGYGHLQGDDCLQQVAHAIEAATRRPGEIVARYGGEEFAVILPYTSAAEAERFGAWICDQVRNLKIPHAWSDGADIITISAGVTTCIPNDLFDIRSLINSTDAALYTAKSEGRNCYRIGMADNGQQG